MKVQLPFVVWPILIELEIREVQYMVYKKSVADMKYAETVRTLIVPSEVLIPHPSRAAPTLCDTVPRFEPAVEAFPVKNPIEVFEANG